NENVFLLVEGMFDRRNSEFGIRRSVFGGFGSRMPNTESRTPLVSGQLQD
ncbi:MAG: hypothetical protein ACI81W_003225, partial [Saprospiraceae bacterium]